MPLPFLMAATLRRFAFLGFCIAIMAGALALNAEDDSSKAKLILYAAKAFTSRTAFSATLDIYLKGEVVKTLQMQRMLAPDGSVLEKEVVTWPNDPSSVSSFSSSAGIFVIAKDKSILKVGEPLDLRNTIHASINEYENRGASYSLSESDFRGTPCYLIKVQNPTDEAAIEEKVNRFLGRVNDPNEHVRLRLPFTKCYQVGKDNCFIYSCAYYNLKGEKTYSAEWGDVDLKSPLDIKTFEVPSGEIAQVEKNSDLHKTLRRFFAMPDMDSNVAESLKSPDGGDANSNKAKALLYKAMRATGKTSFKATNDIVKGGKKIKTINSYHIVTPDGKLFERYDYIWPDSRREVYIPSKTETIAQLNNVLVRVGFRTGCRNFIYTSVNGDNGKNPVYSIADDAIYKGIPCYKITVKIPSDPDSIEERIKRLQALWKSKQDLILERLPFVRTFLVGKENNFIYACAFYNVLGKRTLSEEWGIVSFDSSFDPSFFTPPKNMPMLTAKTAQDLIRIRNKYAINAK